MNNFELTLREGTAWRTPAASAGRELEVDLAPIPQGTWQSLSRRGNEIKIIAVAGKYFLTIPNQHFGANEYREPGRWLH